VASWQVGVEQGDNREEAKQGRRGAQHRARVQPYVVSP